MTAVAGPVAERAVAEPTTRVAWTAATEAQVGRALVVLSFAWALVVGSNFFQVSTWMLGDLAYHRGVAYTIQGGAWQGEAFYRDLLSYYGGLYPIVTGLAAALAGTSFDIVLSIASWVVPLLWPVALLALGRRVWPDEPLATGVFVLLGTTAAPFTHRVLVWVDGTLAASQNVFPVYPRDVALMLLVAAAAAWLSPGRRTRVVGAGIALAVAFVVHVQVGLLCAWVLVAWTALLWWRSRERGIVLDLLGAGAIAVAASSWWWLPRVGAAIESGGLLLGGFPGAVPLRMDPVTLFMAWGVVAVFAVLAVAVLAARRPLSGRLEPFLAWIVAFLPLVVIDRLVGGSDLLSERRVWLILSIPATALAAAAAVAVVRAMRPAWAAGFIAFALVVPSVPGTVATAAFVRDAWPEGRAGGRTYDPAAFGAVFRELNARVRADGGHVVSTYDAYAAWTWSFSGAQVPSLWLPGPFKVGFDPAVMTGRGYLERVRDQEAAYAGGIGTICRHAEAYGAGSIVLDADDGLVGTHDVTPASAYRVEPADRDASTIRKDVGPGIAYVDQGGLDYLALDAGARWAPGWDAPEARLLAVEIAPPVPPPGSPIRPAPGPLLTVRNGERETTFGTGLLPGPAVRFVVPLLTGADTDLELEALAPVNLIRVTAFEPLSGVEQPDGPFLTDTAALCAGR